MLKFLRVSNYPIHQLLTPDPLRQQAFFIKFKGFLKQGATPKALAASSTVGLLLGVFPVLGVTTLMMGAISVRWRLNLPLMLALSYLIYPLQFLLLIPFVRVGEWLTGAPPAKFSLEAVGEAFEKNFMAALVDLGASNLQAVAGWCLLAIPVGAAVYYGLTLPAFKLILKSRQAGENWPQGQV